jgi:hypothetical protein
VSLCVFSAASTDAFQNRLFRQTKAPRSASKLFDLENGLRSPQITIKGLDLKYKQSIAINNNEDNNPQTRYKLQLGEIDLSKIAITYQDKKSIKLHFI